MLRGVEGGKRESGWAELVIMVDPDLASMPPHPIQGISWSFGDESSGSNKNALLRYAPLGSTYALSYPWSQWSTISWKWSQQQQ